MRVDLKPLLQRLTPTARKCFTDAAGRALSSDHYEITVEHVVLAMLAAEDGEASRLLRHFDKNPKRVENALERLVGSLKSGNGGKPDFSPVLVDWMEDAWLTASLERGETALRTGGLVAQLVKRPGRYVVDSLPELDDLAWREVSGGFDDAVGASGEAVESTPMPSGGGAAKGPAAGPAADGALARFATNFTELARSGKIDPIFGRSREIRQMVDILARRRKNNPIIVGEPGVGKTALVEGLALAIAQGEVPEQLRHVDLVALDLGALQAGASVKGEFENRLKGVIDEVKGSVKPIILFIDEAHTIIGAGGPKGGGDAANLLKPALARGELRTVAATTWAEYKKYFEKDAALERRFQPVKVDEPSEADAKVMLRGLRGVYEKAHGVIIRDEAIEAAVELSHRYIAGRQMPDKAVDLLDTAAARVRVERGTRPEELVSLDEELAALERERGAVERDVLDGHPELKGRLDAIDGRLSEVRENAEALRGRWTAQKEKLEALLDARSKLAEAKGEAQADDVAKATADAESAETAKDAGEGDAGDGSAGAAEAAEAASPEQIAELEKAVEAARAAFREIAGDDALISADVGTNAVARTVASWTGIPVGKMKRDSMATVLDLESKLQERVIGQDHAIETVSEALRIATADIGNPDAPIGVLLFVGPSGVGKTETALALADMLYGGERFLVTINMSEFQEKHTVSRLVGSPPGYVGYGEGGRLTEAVRQKPYSVVLLDEVEKAHLDVMNLFYQVFDKGALSDGEGRDINFRNTVIILTSNLATESLMKIYDTDERPSPDEVVAKIRPELSAHFKPALLARMTVIPYAPIDKASMRTIATLKLGKLAKRLRESHEIETVFSDELLDEVARRCTEAETGARNIDHILRSSLMPMVARELLESLAEGDEIARLDVGLGPDGDFRLDFS